MSDPSGYDAACEQECREIAGDTLCYSFYVRRHVSVALAHIEKLKKFRDEVSVRLACTSPDGSAELDQIDCLVDTEAEHRSCLAGDEGWADKWHERYDREHTTVKTLARITEELKAKHDGDVRYLRAQYASIVDIKNRTEERAEAAEATVEAQAREIERLKAGG